MPIFRPTDQHLMDLECAVAAAMFPIVPYRNRLRDSCIVSSDGTRYTVPPNTSGPLPIHGSGWQHSWRETAEDKSKLTLTVISDGPVAGIRFFSNMTLQLIGHTLRIEQSLQNLSNIGFPFGMGLHPCFPRLDCTVLEFSADAAWAEAADRLPGNVVEWPDHLDFRSGKSISGQWRNNAYSNWSRRASIRQPDLGYQVLIEASSIYDDSMLYAPTNGDHFALEPQSHTAGATNLKDPVNDTNPLHDLTAGSTLVGSVTVTFLQSHKL